MVLVLEGYEFNLLITVSLLGPQDCTIKDKMFAGQSLKEKSVSNVMECHIWCRENIKCQMYAFKNGKCIFKERLGSFLNPTPPADNTIIGLRHCPTEEGKMLSKENNVKYFLIHNNIIINITLRVLME